MLKIDSVFMRIHVRTCFSKGSENNLQQRLCNKKYKLFSKLHLFISMHTALQGVYPCSARDWDGKDYLRIIPRVVW
jgi:hypothetical protein